MHRLFLAIRPPEHVRDLLIDAMDDTPFFRWQEEEQLHLTLRFIGEVERPLANDLADSLFRIRAPSFDLKVTGVGRFEQRGGGTLWAGVEPKAPLSTLAAKLDRLCQENGLAAERRTFHPHITLARWKGQRSREVQQFLERRRDLNSGLFLVSTFILFESRLSRHGTHYEQVASYSLGASMPQASRALPQSPG